MESTTSVAFGKSKFLVISWTVTIVFSPAQLADCRPFGVSSIAIEYFGLTFSLEIILLYTRGSGFFAGVLSEVSISLNVSCQYFPMHMEM